MMEVGIVVALGECAQDPLLRGLGQVRPGRQIRDRLGINRHVLAAVIPHVDSFPNAVQVGF